jgi:predicted nucleotidyltransferase
MINPFLQQKLSAVIPMFQKHHVSRAYAFGSVVTDRFGNSSDVDLLISIKAGLDPADEGEHIWKLWDELENLFKRRVDLVTEKSLSNKVFIEELNEKKELLYDDKGS